MKHNIHVAGFLYELRPAETSDSALIVRLRRGGAVRKKFIHTTSSDIGRQEAWMEDYYQRKNDYYFVVKNRLTDEDEGVIGIYDVVDGRAEWGRWVLRDGSFAAIESVWLIHRVAFDSLGLREVYSRTICDNDTVMSFHKSAQERFRAVLPSFCEIDGRRYDVAEFYVDEEYFRSSFSLQLEQKGKNIFNRFLKRAIGEMEFHHVGVACVDFERESAVLRMMGFRQESPDFEDAGQGIAGRFMVSENTAPRLELLKNLSGSHTLDDWLTRKIKLYHFAYVVTNFEDALNWFVRHRAVVVRKPMLSSYFGKRICFIVLPSLLMVELVEK